MRRRTVLKRLALPAVGMTAGCVSASPGGSRTTEQPTGTEPTTTQDTQDTTATVTSQLVDHSFTSKTATCGGGEDTAAVRFETPVQVSGTITGSNSCQVATLASVTYESKHLTVVVETKREETTEETVCTDCLSDIPYTITFEFEGGLPEQVTVKHGDETVLDRER